MGIEVTREVLVQICTPRAARALLQPVLRMQIVSHLEQNSLMDSPGRVGLQRP